MSPGHGILFLCTDVNIFVKESYIPVYEEHLVAVLTSYGIWFGGWDMVVSWNELDTHASSVEEFAFIFY